MRLPLGEKVGSRSESGSQPSGQVKDSSVIWVEPLPLGLMANIPCSHWVVTQNGGLHSNALRPLALNAIGPFLPGKAAEAEAAIMSSERTRQVAPTHPRALLVVFHRLGGGFTAGRPYVMGSEPERALSRRCSTGNAVRSR